MDDKEGNNHSIDKLIENMTSDLQNGDGQYTHLGYTQCSTPPWPDYPDVSNSGYLHQNNLNPVYLQESFSSQSHGSLPFIFNTGEDVLPTMVDVGGGNFMVYGTSNQRNSHPMQTVNKPTTNLSGYNNYNLDTTPPEYNLFSGNIAPPKVNTIHPQYYASQGSNNHPPAHLIENLVGNWTSNQNGTYSQFGDSGLHIPRSCPMEEKYVDSHPLNTPSKPRMVAEVRPMRPSYSDVLTKSVTNKTKSPSNKASKKDMTLNRQHSTGSDETNNIVNNQIKNTNVKKPIPKSNKDINSSNLSKKWVSLDDLESCSSGQDDKKKEIKKKKDAKWEKVGLNNTTINTTLNKTNSNKKPLQINNNLHQEKNTSFISNKYMASVEKKGQGNNGVINNTPPTKEPSQKQSGRKSNSQSSNNSSNSASSEKTKKCHRTRRKDSRNRLKELADRYLSLLVKLVYWLFNLICDVSGLSTHLGFHFCEVTYKCIQSNSVIWYQKLKLFFYEKVINCKYWKKKEKRKDSTSEQPGPGGKAKGKLPQGLVRNLPLPATGDEAMKRLLSCKGKDPYSILGVTHDCTDDDIKKYYKRQAFLVHPDKNKQPGAEEAFKILVHAFDIIGEPEHRKSYDRRVEETQQVEQAWSELSELLSQLHKKMEYVANTIRCTNCDNRHKRTLVDRPVYAARMCASCKIHHSVREGDIWAETSMIGLVWRYYACMDGAVYDITEWAGCQGPNIRHLKPNTHNVQYRIVQGRQQRHTPTEPPSEPDLEDFLNNLYNKTGTGGTPDESATAQGRKKKTKRKK